jgi:hypothetical protein
VLGGRIGPSLWIAEVEPFAVSARTTHRPRDGVFGIGVEDSVRMQSDEQLNGAIPEEFALQLHGVVAGVEDEQRSGVSFRQSS